jgi:hypothetical protein
MILFRYFTFGRRTFWKLMFLFIPFGNVYMRTSDPCGFRMKFNPRMHGSA